MLEVYSREPGCAFEEHYLYDNGECLEDTCVDIICFWWDRDEYQTYEDFKLSCPSNLEVPPEEDFVDDEVIVGGFGEEFGKWHI